LRMLEGQRDWPWHDILRLDKPWFSERTGHEWIWLPTGAKVPERECRTMESTKLMLTIVWNPNAFHFTDVLSNGCKFNVTCYVTNLLRWVSQWQQEQRGGATRNSIVHADNASRHKAAISTSFTEKNRMTRAKNPTYSPDLAFSCLYFFGYVKS
jgi:hypothetical protein